MNENNPIVTGEAPTVGRITLSEKASDVFAFAADVNAEIVAGLREENQRKATEIARLQAKKEMRADVRRAWVEYLTVNAEAIVFDADADKPVRVFDLLERIYHGDAAAASQYAQHLVAVLEGGAWPRMLCANCREVECTGCGGVTTTLVMSRKLANLHAEARHA